MFHLLMSFLFNIKRHVYASFPSQHSKHLLASFFGLSSAFLRISFALKIHYFNTLGWVLSGSNSFLSIKSLTCECGLFIIFSLIYHTSSLSYSFVLFHCGVSYFFLSNIDGNVEHIIALLFYLIYGIFLV